MLTPKMYADEVGVPYPTVMSWLQADLIPGVEKQELPNGKHYYIVPADAPRPETRRGPKPKKVEGEPSTATSAPDDGAPGSAIGEEMIVKRVGKKATKRAK